jgi:teichuronic acid biosynthesis glycosyltransferase TuaG
VTNSADQKHTVSVIMPTFRGGSNLISAVKSVLRQTYPDWELVIVDDASPDDTWETICRYMRDDPRVVGVRQEKNGGPARARNAGLRIATGRYVAFLDSDDLWLPEKLERQVKFMQESGAALSFTWYERIDNSGLPEGRVVRAPSEVGYFDLLRSNRIGCLTAMYDSDVCGKPPMPDIRVHQDWAYWLALTRDGLRAYCLPEVLALYRHSYDSTVSSNKVSTLRYKWQVYRSLEGLSIPRSLFYLVSIAVRGFRKSWI